MNLKSRIFIVAVALLAASPLAYAGRGPDEIQFHQRIQKMDKLIEQTDAAKTPTERGHLLDQHMQEMRACMSMMNDGGAGMSMSKSTDNAAAPMNDRMMQMEKRMEMMQMMMDQMMKQQERSKMMK